MNPRLLISDLEINPTAQDRKTQLLLRALLRAEENANINLFRRKDVFEIKIEDIPLTEQENFKDIFKGNSSININLSHDLLKRGRSANDPDDPVRYEVFKKVDGVEVIDDVELKLDSVKPSLSNINVVKKEYDEDNGTHWRIYYVNDNLEYVNTGNVIPYKSLDNPDGVSEEEMLTPLVMNNFPKLYNAQIAGGGFSRVFLSLGVVSLTEDAIDFKKEPRAIKQLIARDTYDPSIEAQKEYELTKDTKDLRVKPPVIIPATDKLPATAFLVMNYLEGKTLRQKLDADNLSTDERIDLSLKFLYSLKTGLHDRGIVHADIKPANIMIKEKEDQDTKTISKVKIFDLGLGNKTNKPNKEARGTNAYAAPEVIYEEGTSVKSDTYSGGLVLYELWRAKQWLLNFADKDTATILTERNDANFAIDTSDLFEGIKDLSEAHETKISALLAGLTRESTWRRSSIDKAIKIFEDVKLERKLAKLEVKEAEKDEDDKDPEFLKDKKNILRFANTNARQLRAKLSTVDNLRDLNDHFTKALDQIEKKIRSFDYQPKYAKKLAKVAMKDFNDTLGVKAFSGLKTISETRKKAAEIIKQLRTRQQQFPRYHKILFEAKVILEELQKQNDSASFSLELVEKSLKDLQTVYRKSGKYERQFDDIVKFNKKTEKYFFDIEKSITRVGHLEHKMNDTFNTALRGLLPPDTEKDNINDKTRLRNIAIAFLLNSNEQAKKDKLGPILASLLSKPIDEGSPSIIDLRTKLKAKVLNYLDTNFGANIMKGTRAGSDRRLKDMVDILAILDDGKIQSDRDLKELLTDRLKNIEGFFGKAFFSRSSLRNDLLKVLDNHTYTDRLSPKVANRNS